MAYYKKDCWIVSPLNFSQSVKGDRPLGNVVLHDNTLREAEQVAGVTLGVEDKIRIAQALDEVGIPRIELNFQLPHQVESVVAIIDLNLDADIYVTAGSIESIDLARKKNVNNVLIGGIHIDDWSLENIYNKSREWAEKRYVDRISYAKDHGLNVMCFFPDATRADFEYLLHISEKTKEAGADSITLADSMGVALPEAVSYMVKAIKERVFIPLEIHAHNDFGLGVANSLAAYRAGAEVIHSSVNGLAHNAGNAHTEQVAICLQSLYGVDLGLKNEKLYELCNLVSKLAKQTYGHNIPVTGKDIWTYEGAGKILSLREKGKPEVSFPYVPWSIGRQPKFVLGKTSDIPALRMHLDELGIEIPHSSEESLLQEVRSLSIKEKRLVRKDELEKIAHKYI